MKSDMTGLDRLVTVAVVGGVAAGLSEYLMARYELAGVERPDIWSVLRGALVGVVASVMIRRHRRRRGGLGYPPEEHADHAPPLIERGQRFYDMAEAHLARGECRGAVNALVVGSNALAVAGANISAAEVGGVDMDAFDADFREQANRADPLRDAIFARCLVPEPTQAPALAGWRRRR